MADFVTDADYTVGEIVPRCGCMLDVFVKHEGDITIGGLPPSEWPGRVLGVFPAGPGVICVRLALSAGDRLVVRPNLDALPRYRTVGYGAIVESEMGAFVRLDDVRALLAGVA